MRLRLMTFNVQHCYNQITKDINYDAVAKEIIESQADIVGLNEVYGMDSIYGDQVKKIAMASGMKYMYFAKAIDAPNGAYGNGIISKYPIKSIEKIMIPDPIKKENPNGYYETRCIIKARLESKITVMISHFGLNPDEHRRAVYTVVSNLENEKCILMGDFNMRPDNDILMPINTKMHDASMGYCNGEFTFSSIEPFEKIDYIFVSKDIIVNKSFISTNIVSDHFYHFAEIEV